MKQSRSSNGTRKINGMYMNLAGKFDLKETAKNEAACFARDGHIAKVISLHSGIEYAVYIL